MEDFRDSKQYQIFTACRTKRDKYDKAIDTFDQTISKEMSAAKRAAIEAMAYNESCMLSAKKVEFSRAEPSLNEVAVQAFLSYRDRVDSENAVMASIITNQIAQAGDGALKTYTVVAVEKSRFARLDSFPKGSEASATPLWLYAAAFIVVVLAVRGFLKKSAAAEASGEKDTSDVGVVKQSFNFTKSFAQGLYGEFKTIRDGLKKEDTKKKDDENV